MPQILCHSFKIYTLKLSSGLLPRPTYIQEVGLV